ncbi:MAG: PIG-L family deacetylase [Methanoregula sp.]
MKTVLFISAHADDAILAAGGVLKKYIEQKYDVHYLAFSIAEDSVPEGFEKNIVESECQESLSYLGLQKKNIHIFHYKVRTFQKFRQSILDEIIKLKKQIKPVIVFTPSTQDIHQDHEVVCKETTRAFMKACSIYGYDFPWNSLYESKINLFIELNDYYLSNKINACSFFKSQLCKQNNCLTSEYITSLAIERGNRINKKYAESFEIIREIWGVDDDQLY